MSPYLIVSTYYFLYFLSLGSILPFFALYFSHIGLTDNQIGIVAAGPSLLVLLITLTVGSLADRAKDWRSAIIVCNALAAVVVLGMFLGSGFATILTVWTGTVALVLAVSPVLDAAAIRMARHRGIAYHKMRAFGSLGFIAGTLLSGWLFSRFGIEIFVYVFVALALSRAAVSVMLPHFRQGIESTNDELNARMETQASPPVLRQSWFLMVLLGSALIMGSHAYYYTFGSVLWRASGYNEAIISWLWAFGVVIEVFIMWGFARVSKRFSARRLLMFAGFVAAVRWALFTLPLPLSLLMAVQALHGLTFAILFLATVNFIANWTPVANAAKAQSLSAALGTGCMSAVTLGSGWLHDRFGEQGYWLMLLMAMTGVFSFGWDCARTLSEP